MDPLSHQVPQRVVHRALPLKPAFAGEDRRLDLDREMAFAAAVMAGMAAMSIAVVDHSKFIRSEGVAKAFLDFGRYRAGESAAHLVYIGRLSLEWE